MRVPSCLELFSMQLWQRMATSIKPKLSALATTIAVHFNTCKHCSHLMLTACLGYNNLHGMTVSNLDRLHVVQSASAKAVFNQGCVLSTAVHQCNQVVQLALQAAGALTLSSPVVWNVYTSGPYLLIIVWHSGTLVLSTERQCPNVKKLKRWVRPIWCWTLW